MTFQQKKKKQDWKLKPPTVTVSCHAFLYCVFCNTFVFFRIFSYHILTCLCRCVQGVPIYEQRVNKLKPGNWLSLSLHLWPLHPSMAAISNGSAKKHVKVPEIKFTKLFINGQFVDSVSGFPLPLLLLGWLLVTVYALLADYNPSKLKL